MRKKGAKSSRMEYLDYLHIVRERLRRKKGEEDKETQGGERERYKQGKRKEQDKN